MTKEEYLQILTEQIRCKKARKPVETEIRNHIDDQMESNMMNGMEQAKALEAAIMEMGDPVEVGVSLDRIHRKKMPWKEIIIIGILGITGLILQSTLQNMFDVGEYSIPVNMEKQFVLFCISMGLMIGTCCLDYSWIGYYAKEWMILLTMGTALGQIFFGSRVNGSARWISFGSISFSVPMILLLFVPLYGAILYSYRGKGYKGIFKAICWMFPGIVLAWMTRNMFTFMLLLFLYALLLSAAVMKNWYKVSKYRVLTVMWGSIFVLPFLMLGLLVLSGKLEVYQSQRLKVLFSLTDGNHYVLNYIRSLLANCSWTGNRNVADTFLVKEHILTYLLSYYGIFAGILLIIALSALFIHLYVMSVKQKNQMGMMMGIGCASVFLLEFVLYILENLGIVYVMFIGSCYCPFLTYGGSGMLVTYILFGIILSIQRHEKIYPESGGKKRISVHVKVTNS